VGIDVCLSNIDKKFKTQITSLMTPRFQVFKSDQIMAGQGIIPFSFDGSSKAFVRNKRASFAAWFLSQRDMILVEKW